MPDTLKFVTFETAPPTTASPLIDSELPPPATVELVVIVVPLSVVDPSSVTALP